MFLSCADQEASRHWANFWRSWLALLVESRHHAHCPIDRRYSMNTHEQVFNIPRAFVLSEQVVDFTTRMRSVYLRGVRGKNRSINSTVLKAKMVYISQKKNQEITLLISDSILQLMGGPKMC